MRSKMSSPNEIQRIGDARLGVILSQVDTCLEDDFQRQIFSPGVL